MKFVMLAVALCFISATTFANTASVPGTKVASHGKAKKTQKPGKDAKKDAAAPAEEKPAGEAGAAQQPTEQPAK